MNKWDAHFMRMAREAASMSKDPSTKVGAVIVDPRKRLVGTGFNGFPRGVPDAPEWYADREFKYKIVVHAEINAILNASQLVTGCTIYCTFFPCPQCASFIIQAGIDKVKFVPSPSDHRWAKDQEIASRILTLARVEMEQMNEPDRMEPGADCFPCRV